MSLLFIFWLENSMNEILSLNFAYKWNIYNSNRIHNFCQKYCSFKQTTSYNDFISFVKYQLHQLYIRKKVKTRVFCRVLVGQSFVFCVAFNGSLFAFLSFLLWSLFCLSCFDLRLLLNHMLSSSYFGIKVTILSTQSNIIVHSIQ